MSTTETLTACQEMIYTRSRIVDTLHTKSPKYSDIQARDITSISFEDALLACNIDGSQLHLKRSDILKNFWQHRTRKPSYFSYKNLNSETAHVRNRDGQAIGKLSYKSGTTVLEILRSRIGSLATDENGKKITYCIHPDNKTCTCSSWKEMNEHRDELEKEFAQFSDIKFKYPICKHMSWYYANLALSVNLFEHRQKYKYPNFNPKICVYHFDHRENYIKYRITDEGFKTNGKWLPIDGWKNKPIFTTGGVPTGECWNVLNGALSNGYSLQKFSESVALQMGKYEPNSFK